MSVSLGRGAKLFFQEHDLGIAIAQQLSGGVVSEPIKRPDRLFYMYSDNHKKDVLKITLDEISLKAAIEYYCDIFALGSQNEEQSHDIVNGILNPSKTAVALKGFYSEQAKAVIQVGTDVLIGNEN